MALAKDFTAYFALRLGYIYYALQGFGLPFPLPFFFMLYTPVDCVDITMLVFAGKGSQMPYLSALTLCAYSLIHCLMTSHCEDSTLFVGK